MRQEPTKLPGTESRYRRPKVILLYLGLVIGAIVALFPFFWMVVTAFKPEGEALSMRLVPTHATLENFRQVATQFRFGRYFLNSLVVAVLAALFSTSFASLGAYAFAKKDFLFKNQLFVIFLASMMIPGMMFMVPQFVLVFQFGEIPWLGLGEALRNLQLMGMNTYGAMIIPHLANAFGLLLLTQYMKTIPSSLIEAAHMDGASEMQVFRNVIVPLSVPIIATVFLLSFQFHWNNFLWQLIVTNDEGMYTVPVGLAMFKGQHEELYSLKMAASCFSIIPIAVLFLFTQEFFIEGITKGAVKG